MVQVRGKRITHVVRGVFQKERYDETMRCDEKHVYAETAPMLLKLADVQSVRWI